MSSTSTDRIAGISTSVAIKAPVRAATTANITLSAAQTIDGIAVVADDRVLVKDQTDTTENGIYECSSGSWTRTEDFDGPRDVVTGTTVFVVLGSSNVATYWYISTSGNPSPGEAMAFTKATVTGTSLGTIATQNSNNVTITGGSITAITDIAVADGGTGSSTAAGARTNLGLGSMSVQASSSVSITGGAIAGITDLAVTDGGTGASTAANARTNLGVYSTAQVDALIPAAATQADQETATSATAFVTPARQQYHPSAAKFWVKCDFAGTVNASDNVTSVTDGGAGLVTVTIANDFSGAEWAVGCTVERSSDGIGTLSNQRYCCVKKGTQAAGSIGFEIFNNGGYQDAVKFHAWGWGDQ